MLVTAVGEAFRSSFLLAGAAGLLAAALLAAGAQLAAMAVASALALGTPAAYFALHHAHRARRRRRSRTRAIPTGRCPRRAA